MCLYVSCILFERQERKTLLPRVKEYSPKNLVETQTLTRKEDSDSSTTVRQSEHVRVNKIINTIVRSRTLSCESKFYYPVLLRV